MQIGDSRWFQPILKSVNGIKLRIESQIHAEEEGRQGASTIRLQAGEAGVGYLGPLPGLQEIDKGSQRRRQVAPPRIVQKRP